MSLSTEERNTLISLQKEKSESFFDQANFLCENKMWDIAANRYYYSMYHLVHALFLCYGLSCHTHAGLISLFHKHFVKTNLVSEDCGAILSRLEQMRERADYNCSYNTTEKEVLDIRPFVAQFIHEVENLISVRMASELAKP